MPHGGRRISEGRWQGIAALLGLIAFFWLSYWANSTVRERARSIRQVNQPPILLSGIEIRLDRFVAPPVMASHRSDSWTLVLVCSDLCPQSQAEVPAWMRLLDAVSWGDDDRLVVLTAHGRQIPDQLLSGSRVRSIRHEIVRVTDVMSFRARTGIGWTPATLALDGAMRVRAVTERLTPMAADHLIRMFPMRWNSRK